MSPSDSKGQELQQSVKKDNVAKGKLWQKWQSSQKGNLEEVPMRNEQFL